MRQGNERFVHARRAVSVALIAVGIFSLGMAASALFQTGPGWDARIDTVAAIEIRSLAPHDSLDTAYAAVYSTAEFYGILVQQTADALQHSIRGLVGASPVVSGTNFLSPDALETYRWQGIVTLTLAALGAASLGCAIGFATRSLLAGSFAWAALLTTPVYLGLSFIDFKDMPVAAGFTMMSAGLMLSRVWVANNLHFLVAFPLSASGACIALGVRPGLWPLTLALLLGSLVVFAFSDIQNGRWRDVRATGAVAFGSIGVALGFVWLTNPLGRIDFWQWMFDSYFVMQKYPWPGSVRTNGVELLASDLPWWYIPIWLLAQLPLLTTFVIAAGVVLIGISIMSLGRFEAPFRLLLFTPLMVQGIVIPIAIVANGSTLYDGLRQVLFIVPALVGIGAVFIAMLEHGACQSRNVVRLLPVLLTVAVIGAGLFANLRWYPYMYAFVNPIAGWEKQERMWELDYWGVTAFEGVHRLRESGLNPVGVGPGSASLQPLGALPLVEIQQGRPQAAGVYVFKRADAQLDLSRCSELFTIVRDGHTLGQGGACW